MLVTFALMAGVIAADQATKAIVVARLPEGAATSGLAGLRLRHVVNRRHPWASQRAVVVMTLVWSAFVGFSTFVATTTELSWGSLALSASLGGAAGNLIDGFRRRAVIDFIDLRVWPVFNVADAAIVGGALLLAATVIASG